MARFFEINGVKFNSVKYDGREWVLASEVAPYIKVKNLTVAQQPQVRICYLRKRCVDKGPGKVCMLPYRAQYLSCLGSKRQTVR